MYTCSVSYTETDLITVTSLPGCCTRRRTWRDHCDSDGWQRRELLGRAQERLWSYEEPGCSFQRPPLCGKEWKRSVQCFKKRQTRLQQHSRPQPSPIHEGLHLQHVSKCVKVSLLNKWMIKQKEINSLVNKLTTENLRYIISVLKSKLRGDVIINYRKAWDSRYNWLEIVVELTAWNWQPVYYAVLHLI